METFTDFKNSFSYGKRNNLNFKFLSRLTDDEAANFLEKLLNLTGNSFNDGNLEKIIEHVVQGQKYAYSHPSKFTYQEGPFFHFKKSLSESKIGLLTSTGHFVKGDDPHPLGVIGMTQQEAIERINDFLKEEPTLSTIPKNTPIDSLQVCHGGYDISGVLTDHDTAFPLESLIDLERRYK